MNTQDQQNDQVRLTLLWMCGGYRSSLALIGGLELGIFAAIPDEGATAAAVARSIGIDATGARVLLDVLVNSEVLAKDSEQRYHVVSECAPFLRQGADYIGDHMLAQKEECEYWLRAAEIIRGKFSGTLMIDRKYEGASAASTLDVVGWNNHVHPELLWSRLGDLVPSLTRVMDVGAGRGDFTRALLGRNDHVEITIVDAFRGALDACRATLSDHPGFDRVTFELANAVALEHVEAFDLVMANDLLHYFGRADKLEFLRRAHRALRPGGTCLEVGFRLEDGCEPEGAATFSLRMYLHTMKAYLATNAETVELFREAGFRDVTCEMLEGKRLVTGLK